MRIKTVNLKRHLTAIGLLVLLSGIAIGAAPGVAHAEMASPELLERLRSASAIDAPRVEREVETVWSRSGSAAMDLLLKRGREALDKGNIQLAIEHFTALTDHAPDFAEGYHMRAQAYFRANLYGPALDDLETTLSLNPDNFNAIFGFAVMVQEFGNLPRAAELYRRVLAIHPNHENAKAALDAMKRDGIGRKL
ncbi:MAG: tetratricopeptide repeat protein [Sulfitobacter sp.]